MSDAPVLTRRLIEVDSWNHKAKRRVKSQVVVDVLPASKPKPSLKFVASHAPPQRSEQRSQTAAINSTPHADANDATTPSSL